MVASSRSTPLQEPARAKINLALHVTGRRQDGYHLLDSLVVFPDLGDRLTLETSNRLTLQIDGPFAADLREDLDDNLVLRAVKGFAAITGTAPSIRLTLTKVLPVASGIGGGSADAAAAIRLMERHSGRRLDPADRLDLALSLGADVPVCLDQRAARMSGIGETVVPVPALPAAGIVLVNPRQAVATPEVFKAMAKRDNPPLPELPGAFADLDELLAYLETTRNDLQAAAERLCPAIPAVMRALSELDGVRFARMSGSGATCFALCAAGAEAALAEALRARHTDWWVAAGRL